MRPVNRPTPTPTQEVDTDIGELQGNWKPNDLRTERIAYSDDMAMLSPQYRGSFNVADLNGLFAFNGGERFQTLQVVAPNTTIEVARLSIRQQRELRSIKSCSRSEKLTAKPRADSNTIIAPPNDNSCCGGD